MNTLELFKQLAGEIRGSQFVMNIADHRQELIEANLMQDTSFVGCATRDDVSVVA